MGQPGNVDGPGTFSAENNFYAQHIGSHDCLVSIVSFLETRISTRVGRVFVLQVYGLSHSYSCMWFIHGMSANVCLLKLKRK